MSVILEVKGATKRYGGLVAVNNVSFIVNEGEILSVIGPNGAGKSTLFKLIASFVQTSAGEVLLRGERISDLAPHTVARKGVVRTFQETTIFKSMTVRENIIVAHHLRSRASLLGFFLGTGLAKADEALFAESADGIIDFLGLQTIRDELASNLPQGHLRALGMAIGLATQPAVLLLDEPFAGMNHDETMHMVTLVRRLRDERGVVALGGGAVMNPTTSALLKEQTVVWLSVTLSDAANRVGMNTARPLLLGNVRGQLKSLMDERAPTYEAVSTYTVDTSGKTLKVLADEVAALVGGDADA